jgi:DNA replication protein DnaC
MLTSLSFITDGKPPELELEILDEDARKYNLAQSRAISSPKIEYKPRAFSSMKFTGRRDYLTKLRTFFDAESDRPYRRKSFLLYGMGGIGKTQICLKFTEENLDM